MAKKNKQASEYFALVNNYVPELAMTSMLKRAIGCLASSGCPELMSYFHSGVQF